jgi:hypothetical protein
MISTRLTDAINRRAFLKRAGLGSIAVGSLPWLAESATPAWADDTNRGFSFTAISRAATIGTVTHAANMAGFGSINDSEVEGGGHFQHYDLASAPPRTIFAAGRWEATRLLSFNPVGTWGVITAGVAVMEVNLLREIPSPAVITATLKVVCNVGSGGFDTGQPEGFTLTIPGAPFGAFVPFGAGITVFTTLLAEGD